MTQTEQVPAVEAYPSYDLVYQKIIQEQFDALALNDAFAKGLERRFRQGPMTACSRAIGTWVNLQLRKVSWTQQELADRLGVDRSAVAYWIRGGNINLVNLAQVLLEFHCHWSELPIPPRQELALAAYLAALAYVQERVHPEGGKRLDRERFWALFHLFSEPSWERAVRRRDPDLLQAESDRIATCVQASLGKPPTVVVGVETLKQLVSDWGVAWLVCIGQVPCNWGLR
jgi:transcriptional regulator with XRE-family HTH domain